VIKVYDIENYENTLVLILEDFGGKSLKKILELKQLITKRALTTAEFLPLAIRLTTSLKEIHAAHIIHRDINPRNIVWNAVTDQLKIIDFGLAVVLTSAYSVLKRKTDQPTGTLLYISPEQTGKTAQAIIDYRTDLYALGATFYELLSGKPPFDVEDSSELVQHHLHDPPVPVRELVPEVPEIVSNIITKLMAKEIKARYQSASVLQKDLELCLRRLQFKQISS
jgi:serine/threonine protein kinase